MDVRNDLNPPPVELRRPAVEPAKQMRPGGDTSGSALPADSASVSHAARLADQTMQLPDVRAEKVAAVQKAMADGSYSIGAVDVAGAMLGEERSVS
ncbi:MAG: flagellar biosynthesis anti-sigma factor FlgM [Acidobacteriaceae bacterium]